MLDPGLANLLKAIVVVRSTAHSIEILRYDRMVCIWQPKVIHWHVSGVANNCAHAQADLSPGASKLFESFTDYGTNISRDNIGPRVKHSRSALSIAAWRRQHQKQDDWVPEITRNFHKHGPSSNSEPVGDHHRSSPKVRSHLSGPGSVL